MLFVLRCCLKRNVLSFRIFIHMEVEATVVELQTRSDFETVNFQGSLATRVCGDQNRILSKET